ncbi:MAG TPA: tetratricopeptide repeat protein [Myxococcales bacterium]|nr:tetratricopeptide repeat protein [Myxococcales bacterium]
MDELLRVRGKVERGEPLSPGEREALERAAASSDGPTLRLAVAQSLLNDGAEREALRLLERLVRDFPRDLQAHLGHARALAGLERYAAAEQALKGALALSPEDPEALKVMAVLALRRGERERAGALVSAVLRIDPFDGEARLLKEELEAADLPPPAPEASGELRQALERRRVRHLFKGGELLVLVKGELRRTPLPQRLDVPADQFVSGLLDLPALGSGAEALLGAVLPVLREPAFAELARGAAHREGPAGLVVFYVLEHPELVRYLPRAAVDAAGVTLEALDQAAFHRLGRSAVEPKRVSSAGVWMIAAEDGHDGARLLTPAQRERLRAAAGEGPWRVDLGRREAAFACREADAAAVRALEELPPAEDGIPGRFRLTGSGLERAG